MKLRIHENSIRFRLLRSEVDAFLSAGNIKHTIRLAPEEQAVWIYGLAHDANAERVEVRYKQPQLIVVLPRQQVFTWAESEQIGIYATIDFGVHGGLDIIVEKDFACLDLSDADNSDTFTNPQIGVSC